MRACDVSLPSLTYTYSWKCNKFVSWLVRAILIDSELWRRRAEAREEFWKQQKPSVPRFPQVLDMVAPTSKVAQRSVSLWESRSSVKRVAMSRFLVCSGTTPS
jgi:hypothetical protein